MFDGILSDLKKVNYIVPQGYVLGIILFYTFMIFQIYNNYLNQC